MPNKFFRTIVIIGASKIAAIKSLTGYITKTEAGSQKDTALKI